VNNTQFKNNFMDKLIHEKLAWSLCSVRVGTAKARLSDPFGLGCFQQEVLEKFYQTV
jgi:hypothetical protein